jgi:NAD(P)-dependent dehydrogenase (short-subunit alcohol dehydrogenase family)
MTTTQSPLPSGFGAATTAAEAIGQADLRGKIAIVTGGYSGLGLETTRVLVAAGATVIVPSRSPDKAAAALATLPASAQIEQAALDLLDPASIATFAQALIASGRPLHMLINCAGIMAAPLTRDARGYESQFSANHLGHFQLTAMLLPALKQAHGARVVSVSSRGHRFAGIDFDDPQFARRDYDKWKAYGQSKTANILFALELDRRGAAHGIRAFSVHPGRILDTGLVRHLSNEDLRAAGVMDEQGNLVGSALSKTVAQGASTIAWCAASPQLDGLGGVYCEDTDIAPAIAADAPADATGVRPWAVDPALAAQLWTLSEALTATPFAI